EIIRLAIKRALVVCVANYFRQCSSAEGGTASHLSLSVSPTVASVCVVRLRGLRRACFRSRFVFSPAALVGRGKKEGQRNIPHPSSLSSRRGRTVVRTGPLTALRDLSNCCCCLACPPASWWEKGAARREPAGTCRGRWARWRRGTSSSTFRSIS
ncbi:unnamed protein product, partial [Ectocarpus sp. 12 AP-2014]